MNQPAALHNIFTLKQGLTKVSKTLLKGFKLQKYRLKSCRKFVVFFINQQQLEIQFLKKYNILTRKCFVVDKK
jgi:hypothetical protein